jgi:hypothetical protein
MANQGKKDEQNINAAALANDITAVQERLTTARRKAADGEPLQALDIVDSVAKSLLNISKARRG